MMLDRRVEKEVGTPGMASVPVAPVQTPAASAGNPHPETMNARGTIDLAHFGGIPETGTPKALLSAATNPDPQVRKETARLLGAHYGDAMEPLLNLAQDPDEGVRRAAFQAIGHVGLPEGLARLQDEALGRGPAVRAQPEELVFGKLAATKALGESGKEEALPMLLNIADRSGNLAVRLEAVQAMGDLGEMAIEDLRKMVGHQEITMACQASRVLGDRFGIHADPADVWAKAQHKALSDFYFDQAPEPYENDLEAFSNQEAWEDAQADMRDDYEEPYDGGYDE